MTCEKIKQKVKITLKKPSNGREDHPELLKYKTELFNYLNKWFRNLLYENRQDRRVMLEKVLEILDSDDNANNKIIATKIIIEKEIDYLLEANEKNRKYSKPPEKRKFEIQEQKKKEKKGKKK